MKRKSIIFLILFVCSITVFLTGCWDYKEITDRIIVAGMAVDYDKANNGISLTVEIIIPEETSEKTSFIPKLYQSDGRNMIEAAENIASKAGHDLLWSHCKIMILSRDIFRAKNLFTGVMDWVKRDFEARQNTKLLVTEEQTAGEIFTESDPQTEPVNSFYLDHLFLSENLNGFIIKTTYWEFMDSINSVSGGAALSCVHLQESETGKIPYIVDTAVFRKSIPVIDMDNHQTKILLLLENKINNLMFILNQSENDKTQNITFETVSNKTKIKPVYSDKNLSMQISLDLEIHILEIDTDKDVLTENTIKELGNSIKNKINQFITQFIDYLKTNNVDVLGFADKIDQQYPGLWKQIEKDWDNIFSEIPCNVAIQLQISGSEESMKNTKVGK